MAVTYTVADYLLDRLAELDVDRVFGVPGDYSLALLDHVVHHDTVRWTGTTNELNAGYAADGYGDSAGSRRYSPPTASASSARSTRSPAATPSTSRSSTS